MGEVKPFRKNLHLNKQEAGMILILVVLLSGLMFSVGLWVGMGATPVSSLQASADLEGAEGRAPASEETEEKVIAGAKLRNAYKVSKRRALDKVMLEMENLSEPRSAMDAKAHAGANTQWDRNPASEKIDEEKLEEAEALAKKEAEQKKKGPPEKVAGLFERSVDSVKDFSPVMGSFTVQVASFATEDEALSMVRQLRKAGFLESYSKEIKFDSGEIWHRVAIGSYPNPIFARKIGSKVKQRGLTQDFIVRKVSN